MANLGPASIALVPSPPDQFLVQFPERIEQSQVIERLTQRSQLTFRLQHPLTPPLQTLLAQQNLLQTQLKASPPDPRQLQQQLAQIYAKLYGPAMLTEKNVVDAQAQENSVLNNWDIRLRFDAEGAQQFQEMTKTVAGTQRAIGIFLDDQLLSAPIVPTHFAETGIVGGEAVITGNYDQTEASTFASQVKAGSLPAQIKVLSVQAVRTEQCDASKPVHNGSSQ